ncbi:MAG: Uncharacterised protein [Prochlorococcus marinus str. MIT 9313]|nr:MAG: Uncharacterised protein [Prochlorococcus marinus str. MIT 9313]
MRIGSMAWSQQLDAKGLHATLNPSTLTVKFAAALLERLKNQFDACPARDDYELPIWTGAFLVPHCCWASSSILSALSR